MAFNPNEPQDGADMRADVLRNQFTGLKEIIDAVPAGPPGPQGPQGPPGGTNPETDPVFTASEAAQFVPGDKAKLDTALQPGGNVSALANDAGYMTNPMSSNAPGDMIYTMWSDTAPGATMRARLAIGTPGQVLTATPDWQNGTGVFPAWRDLAGQNVGYTPANPEKWANAPASVAEAIDRMATAMAALLGTPIP